MSDTLSKLWGGRFGESAHPLVEQFTASVHFDHRLYRQDIAGSMAHARMLQRVGVLTADECEAITAGLSAILQEIEQGTFKWSAAHEDVHMNIEARLSELAGAAGRKLHTGRSRNDQVATDMRLWLRDAIDELDVALVRVAAALLDQVERHADAIMPGFTHLQIAQPVTFGHHLLAWFEMLLRDRQRLADCRKRVNVMPLGAAALAGTSFPVDRQDTARALGFDEIAQNSMDAVSDRDFAIEFAAWASTLLMHLSRFSEELVLWMSPAFGFVSLPDRFCTGSSIMPQKKNPDVPELVRGQAGRATGHLMSLLMLMKAQPLAYNRDNQQDKEPLFDLVDMTRACLAVYAEMIPELLPDRQAMQAAAAQGYATATDLADYLVRGGLPFRDAHELTGRIVAHCQQQQRSLDSLSLAELREFSERFDDDLFALLTVQGSVAARDHPGGTAPVQVRAAVASARQRLMV